MGTGLSQVKIGEKYTGSQLAKKGILPKWHKYAKTRCKWEVLELEQVRILTHSGDSAFKTEVTLRGKPKTQAGKTRKNPIKVKWIFD